MLVNGKICVKLDKDKAIRFHRKMWRDMANEEKAMGKTFSAVDRSMFKRDWLQQHDYSSVEHCCFLCEYARSQEDNRVMRMAPFYCDHCPLDWKKLVPEDQIRELTEYDGRYGTCIFHVSTTSGISIGDETYLELWTVAPIEDIANLPEKEEEDGQ